MKRQTLLGLLFLCVGLAIVAVVLAPVVAAVFAKQPAPPISVFLLCVGIGVALFGAWEIPSSGIGTTAGQVVVTLGKTKVPFFGGAPTTTTTVEVTTPAPPPTLPKDGV